MIARRHPLTHASPGTQRELLSLHYGPVGGAKAFIQASLHADEVPAMLVAHHLRGRLAELEAAGRLRGEIVLLPFANPIGLAQRLLFGRIGRFELGSGSNFNRHYADLTPSVAARVAGRLTGRAAEDVALIRAELRAACAALPADGELESLRRLLLGLAIDADLVLDLHSDKEAVLHLYTGTAQWPDVEPLARLLGAHVTLLADESGDDPFDEACSTLWPRLARRLSRDTGAAVELPQACIAVTVELRGETDVEHGLAQRDAEALLDYLALRGFVDAEPRALPPPRGDARPLAGCLPVTATGSGVVVWLRAPGDHVSRGDILAELVDPLSGAVTPLASPADGLLLARELRRFAQAGDRLAKVAGTEAVRSGKLLSA